jgi:solute:Na+ symporter, SSS family
MTEAFSFQLNAVDYTVITLYLALLLGVGFVFKRLAHSMKDYFIGGSKVAWWMVGASMFMQSFSCWTFTGAAGFAYRFGILMIFLFWANASSFLVAGIYMAPKMRQTRVTTWLEIIYERFGRAAEQFITWLRLPLTIFSGGIWLMSLGLVVSIATGLPIQMVILVTGMVVVVYATVGGSWGVMATDFVQSLVMITLAVALFILSVMKIGGPGEFFSQIPEGHLRLISSEHNGFWVAAYFIQIFTMFIGIQGAPKFLSTKDGKDARKAAFLASALFFVGPVIWFVPPMIARCLHPDIGEVLPAFDKAYEGAYVLMGLSLLPHGLTALFLMIMFAATVSTMDIVVNQNSSMVIINLYKAFVRPKASDHELFVVGHFLNAFFGVLAMSLALLFTRSKDMDLFQLNVFASTVMAAPIGITCALIYFVRHCPRWAGLFSVVSGMLYSVVTQHGRIMGMEGCTFCTVLDKTGITAAATAISRCFGIENFHVHEPWPLQMQVFGMVFVCVGTYLFAGLFHKKESTDKKALTDAFYEKMDRPVDFESEVGGSEDMRQLIIIGILAMIIGSGICLLAFFAGSLSGIISCLGVGGVVLTVGIIFYRLGLKSKNQLAK